MKFLYVNRDDPKVFVYKDPEHRWVGVTLNFAHWKAWLVLLGTYFPICLWIGASCMFPPLNSDIFFVLWLAVFILYIIGTCIWYFRMAAKEHGQS